MKRLHTVADLLSGALLLWLGGWAVWLQPTLVVSITGGVAVLLGLALVASRVAEWRGTA